MQTFLPYPSFVDSVRCLDYRRLGKQRVEARQILRAIRLGGGGWENHPACKMWRGHAAALELYGDCAIREWVRRGYNNTMRVSSVSRARMPDWLGGEIHATHRAALLAKDRDWYGQFGWREEPEIAYFWPADTTEKTYGGVGRQEARARIRQARPLLEHVARGRRDR
jgi:hypothetical protein